MILDAAPPKPQRRSLHLRDDVHEKPAADLCIFCCDLEINERDEGEKEEEESMLTFRKEEVAPSLANIVRLVASSRSPRTLTFRVCIPLRMKRETHSIYCWG